MLAGCRSRREDVVNRALHLGIQVDRVDDVDIRALLRQIMEGPADIFKARPEILPAVAGHQNQTLAVQMQAEVLRKIIPPAVSLLAHPGGDDLEGVDDRIAGNPDVVRRHLLRQEVVPGPGRGGKMVIGYDPGEAAVQFLRIGPVFVPGAQARLHVPHRNPEIIRRQGRAKGGRGIPVDQDHIRPLLRQDLPEASQDPDGDVKEVLVRGHEVQVIIRHDPEDFQHLVQHLAVLGRDRHLDLEVPGLFQAQDHRGHLDGLGPGAENNENLFQESLTLGHGLAHRGGDPGAETGCRVHQVPVVPEPLNGIL